MTTVDTIGLLMLCTLTISVAFVATVAVSWTGCKLTLTWLRNIVIMALLAIMVFPADALMIGCLLLGVALSYPYTKS